MTSFQLHEKLEGGCFRFLFDGESEVRKNWRVGVFDFSVFNCKSQVRKSGGWVFQIFRCLMVNPKLENLLGGFHIFRCVIANPKLLWSFGEVFQIFGV